METYPNEFELDEAAQAEYYFVLEAHIACIGLVNCAAETEDGAPRPPSERQSARVVANAVKFSDLEPERVNASLAKALTFQPEHLRDEVFYHDLDDDELETTVLSLIFHKNGATGQFLDEERTKTRGQLDADQMTRVTVASKMINSAEQEAKRSNPTQAAQLSLVGTANEMLNRLGRPTMTVRDEEVVLRGLENSPSIS